MIEVEEGGTILFELVVADGSSGLFPQVELYTSGGGLSSTTDLTNVADGLYQATLVAPAAGHYSAIYLTYTDAGHTTLDTQVDQVAEHYRIFATIEDQVWDSVRASHVTAGTFGEGVASVQGDLTGNVQNDVLGDVAGNVDGSVGSIASGGISNTSFAAGAIDAAALATDAAQEIRDEILSDSTPFAGADIAAILADTAAIDARLPSDPADQSLLVAEHTQTQADIAALNDPSATDVADAVWDEAIAGHLGAGSTGAALNDAEVAATAVDGRLPTDPADQSLLVAEHTQTQSDIAALNNLAIADVQTALTNQGYTASRAPNLDNLDATVSSRSTLVQADILSDATPFAGADVADILADTSAIDTRLPSDPADESLQQASHAQTQADIAALNNISIADVQTAMTNQGYTVARAPSLDNLDAAVSSRSVLTQTDILSDATPFAGADIADILTDTSAMDARLPSDPADESLQQASHAQTQADIASLNNLSVTDVQTALTAQGYTSGRAPNLDNLDVAISTRSSHDEADVDTQLSGTHGGGNWEGNAGLTQQDIRDAMKLAPTIGAPAAGSVDEHLDNIEADTAVMEPLVSANLDATVSSRAQPGDAMGLLNNSVDADSLAASAVNEIRDGILADSTPFNGADIDAAISSRATQADILSDATPFAGADIDASISSRAAPGDPMDLLVSTKDDVVDRTWDELLAGHLGVGSTGEALSDAQTGASPGAVADAVWDEVRAAHVAVGSFGEALDAKVSDTAVPGDAMTLTAGERTATADAVWDETLPGSHPANSAGERLASTDDNIDVTLSTRAEPSDIISGSPINTSFIDTNISSRSTLTAPQVDSQLSGAHGGGSWEAATVGDIADAVWDESVAGHTTAGTFGESLDNADTASAAIDGRLPSDPADESLQQASHTQTQADIAALNDLSIPDVQTALNSEGYTSARATNLDNLDVAVSTRAAPGDAMDLNSTAVDAIWDELITGAAPAGSAREALLLAAGDGGLNVRDDALTYDGNDRPLTLRRRIFADAATANASTPGGTGEGEIATVTISATHVTASQWQSLLRTK